MQLTKQVVCLQPFLARTFDQKCVPNMEEKKIMAFGTSWRSKIQWWRDYDTGQCFKRTILVGLWKAGKPLCFQSSGFQIKVVFSAGAWLEILQREEVEATSSSSEKVLVQFQKKDSQSEGPANQVNLFSSEATSDYTPIVQFLSTFQAQAWTLSRLTNTSRKKKRASAV